MKKHLLFIFLLLGSYIQAQQAVTFNAPFFQQNFSTSTNVADYIGTGPNQFTILGKTASVTSSIVGGALQIGKIAGQTNGWGLVKHFDFATSPEIVRVVVDFKPVTVSMFSNYAVLFLHRTKLRI